MLFQKLQDATGQCPIKPRRPVLTRRFEKRNQNSAEVCRLRKRGGAANSTEVHLMRA